MSGGSITDNNATSTGANDGGGGIFLYNAVATLSGTAVISNNTTASNGGGIRVHTNSTLTMNGGTISGNNAATGGGVYVNGNAFTMNGGAITGNTTTADGAGVYVTGSAFTLAGGTISGNTGPSAVNIELSTTFTITSGHIENNAGTGVRLRGTLTMSGGSITGNTKTATNYQGGAGMFIYGGAFTMTGGAINGNTLTGADSYGAGIFIYSGTAEIQDGAISGNTGAKFANGIYVHYAQNPTPTLKVGAAAQIADRVGLAYETTGTGAFSPAITVTSGLTGAAPVATIDLMYGTVAQTVAIWDTKPIVTLDGGYGGGSLATESAKFAVGDFGDYSASFTATPIGPAYEIKGDGTLGTP
jgi:predicted outer membrane repeat protein